MAKKQSTAESIVEQAVKGMQEKKAKKVVVMDLRKLNSAVADFFVICHGTNTKQVDAIADSVEEFIFKKCKEHPWHREGTESSEWILLDYINVVVHIFSENKRQFYGIEDLWADAKCTEYDDIN